MSALGEADTEPTAELKAIFCSLHNDATSTRDRISSDSLRYHCYYSNHTGVSFLIQVSLARSSTVLIFFGFSELLHFVLIYFEVVCAVLAVRWWWRFSAFSSNINYSAAVRRKTELLVV